MKMLFAILLYIIFFIIGIAIALLLHLENILFFSNPIINIISIILFTLLVSEVEERLIWAKTTYFEYMEKFKTTPLAMSFFAYLLYSGFYLFVELKEMYK